MQLLCGYVETLSRNLASETYGHPKKWQRSQSHGLVPTRRRRPKTNGSFVFEVILFKSRRDQLLSATLHPPRVFACSLYRYAKLYKLHSSIFFMSQFLFELCLRALDAAVAAMSTSYLALLVAVLFALGSFFYQHRGEGLKNVRGNLFRALSYGAVFWFS